MTKITTKTWLTKVASIFNHRTSLLHRISSPASFYSKTKIGYIFNFHSFGILIFTFDTRVWMTYRFCVIKKNWKNVRCTTEEEKSSKCYARNHTIFVRLRGTAQEYLFRSYQSLHSSRKFTQRRRNFKQKFL